MFHRLPTAVHHTRYSGALLIALALASAASAHGPEEHGAASSSAEAPGGPQALPPGHGQARGDKVRLQGELVDLVCYMQHPENGQGPEHAACARKCMKQGLPPGLLSDGKLYLLMSHGHENYGPTIAQHAGSQVAVEGNLIHSGGMQAVVVSHLSPGGGAGENESHGAGAGPGQHH